MARIAVVEDDPIAREFLIDALEGRGHEVQSYADFSSAQSSLLDQVGIDLLVSDVELPDGSGLELVRQLRASRPSLPVLLQSGRSTEEDLLAGFEAGASDYITKPVSLPELLAKCTVLLSRSGTDRPRPASRDGADLPGGAGRAFGRYEIRGVLGQGGGGIVYDALEHEQGRSVALKVLPILSGVSERSRERFVRETYSLSLLKHPNVIEVLDFGSQEGRTYYAMERIEGVSLSERVRGRGALSEAETLVLLQALAGALKAVHGKGLVHRDLKPANVMLRGGAVDEPVLIDFGLAKLVDDRALTRTGELVGTPAYLSPERIRGQAADARSDIFSLGLTARFALTGQELYEGRPVLELIGSMASQPVHIPASFSAPLRELLRDMTKLDPDKRPSSADEVLARLEALGEEGGV